jgi:hypothetical protein
MRLCAIGSGALTLSLITFLVVTPFALSSSVRGTIHDATAAGGDCCCTEPQLDSTPRVRPESAELLRATIDVPRMIQAQVVKRKMRTMAAMCFPIPASSVPNVAIVWPPRGDAGALVDCCVSLHDERRADRSRFPRRLRPPRAKYFAASLERNHARITRR